MERTALQGLNWGSSPSTADTGEMLLRNAQKLDLTGPKGNRLACYVLGSAANKTAILTSGIGCGPVFLNQIARALSQDHRVIYWDYRAHGSSQKAPSGSGYSIDDHADDLEHVAQAFAQTQRPLMLGFSMGVQVTVEWSRRHPDWASSYVFMLGVPRNPLFRTKVFRAPVARMTDRFARHAKPVLSLLHPATKAALRTRMTYDVARSLGVIDRTCPRKDFLEFVRFATAVAPDAYLRCAAGLMVHDGTDAFRQIRQPTLMLGADRDVLIDSDECEAFAAQLPNVQYETLRHASHAGSIEYSFYVAARIRRFLDDLAWKQVQAA